MHVNSASFTSAAVATAAAPGGGPNSAGGGAPGGAPDVAAKSSAGGGGPIDATAVGDDSGAVPSVCVVGAWAVETSCIVEAATLCFRFHASRSAA